ncbi:hypothetical protein D3C80_1519770 [compost metagenome]
MTASTDHYSIFILACIAFAPLCTAMLRRHRKPTAITLLCVVTVGLLLTGQGPIAALIIWLPNMYWATTGRTFQTPAR